MRLAGGTLLLGAAGNSLSSNTQSQKPNIIYILADDLGYGDLGCYGQRKIKTPNIDKMAAEGLRFTQHYAGSTVCAPSRACLLTGQHTGHVHVRGNGDVMLRPSPEDITIAEMLQGAGYTTAMIGKASVGSNNLPPELPNEKGFDYFFGYLSHGSAHHYFPELLYRNGKSITYPDNKLHEGNHYSQDLFVEDTMRYLEEQKNNRFFLHLSLQIPHASLYA
ncbi:MAG: sulfatase-like hydrolase/transferase, partial [Candidatus Hydrogenedentes bacterium]|nr:sulfatase-like hydrolase/transferase [Candidatus Hydrogenedentota bacterium]